MNTEQILAAVPIFSTLSDQQLALLATLVEQRHFSPGTLLIREGDTDSALYMIISGAVSVSKMGEESGEEIALATLGAGEFVGEMALLDGAPRSATVRAIENTECLVLPRWVFLSTLRNDPEIAVAMLPALTRRIRQANREIGPA